MPCWMGEPLFFDLAFTIQENHIRRGVFAPSLMVTVPLTIMTYGLGPEIVDPGGLTSMGTLRILPPSPLLAAIVLG